jgi:hypothetical protein
MTSQRVVKGAFGTYPPEGYVLDIAPDTSFLEY